ncbi:DHA2 family efflux MFS transporter permease subunit [Lysinibacillus sp. NPDC096418]|uniref:DHA2 family efflux MFS transporter permease subunit n=1 Tax=Lysinibacillus sp. NPDC096418 TaxID=3364138 RepID=UPI00381A6918
MQPTIQLEPKKRTIMLILLVLGSFTSLLNQTLLNVAIPKFSNIFNIELSTAQWLVTGFLLINGIVIPMSAYLIGKFTTRQLFIGALIIFATGTFISAFATNFYMLLTGRLIQAVAGGVMMPLVHIVIFSLFPPNERGKAMGMIGIAMTFAPALGPTLSGWLLQHYSWRALFYVVLPFTLLNIVLCYFFLKNVTETTSPRFDIFGVLTSTIGFGSLLYGFSMAGTQGFGSITIQIIIGVGALFIALFIWRQFTTEQPMLNLRVFTHKQYLFATIIGAFIALAMYSVELLTPVLLQQIMQKSTLQTGLLLLPGAIIMGIMSPIAGSILDKQGIRPLVLVGLTVVFMTSLGYTRITLDTNAIVISIIYTLFLFGVSIMMMTMTTYSVNQLSTELSRHGAAVTNTTRMLAGSIGTALLTTILSTVSARSYEKLQHLPDANIQAQLSGIHAAFAVIMVGSIIMLFLAVKLKRSMTHT